ncbi:hypothetical protein BC829DRAFT_416363 [Chytridium lagenaria]|nr:hypothetical protein BC829DRAFT_416363 [Chytridium lagenaria]
MDTQANLSEQKLQGGESGSDAASTSVQVPRSISNPRTPLASSAINTEAPDKKIEGEPLASVSTVRSRARSSFTQRPRIPTFYLNERENVDSSTDGLGGSFFASQINQYVQSAATTTTHSPAQDMSTALASLRTAAAADKNGVMDQSAMSYYFSGANVPSVGALPDDVIQPNVNNTSTGGMERSPSTSSSNMPVSRQRPTSSRPRIPTFYLLEKLNSNTTGSNENSSENLPTFFGQYVQSASQGAASSLMHSPEHPTILIMDAPEESRSFEAFASGSGTGGSSDAFKIPNFIQKLSREPSLARKNVASPIGSIPSINPAQFNGLVHTRSKAGSTLAGGGFLVKLADGDKNTSIPVSREPSTKSSGYTRSSSDGIARVVRNLLPKKGTGMKESDADRDARFNFWTGLVTVFPWILNLSIAMVYGWLSLTFSTIYVAIGGIFFQAMSKYNWPMDPVPEGWFQQSIWIASVVSVVLWCIAVATAVTSHFARKRKGPIIVDQIGQPHRANTTSSEGSSLPTPKGKGLEAV